METEDAFADLVDANGNPLIVQKPIGKKKAAERQVIGGTNSSPTSSVDRTDDSASTVSSPRWGEGDRQSNITPRSEMNEIVITLCAADNDGESTSEDEEDVEDDHMGMNGDEDDDCHQCHNDDHHRVVRFIRVFHDHRTNTG
jgi:hypothetical protein